jgi:hypothetical protein
MENDRRSSVYSTSLFESYCNFFKFHISQIFELNKMNSSERIVLITGGSGYIGHFISRELIKQNYSVVLYDLRPPQEAEAGVSFIQVLKSNLYMVDSL